MPDTTTIEGDKLSAFHEVLGQLQPAGDDSVALSTRILDNVAFYDFSFYEYILPTQNQGLSKQTFGLSSLSVHAFKYLDNVGYAGLPLVEVEAIARFFQELELIVRQAVLPLFPVAAIGRSWMDALLDSLYGRFSRDIASELVTLAEGAGAARSAFLDDLYEQIRLRARIDFLNQRPFDWAEWYRNASAGFLPTWRMHMLAAGKSKRADAHPFEVFPQGSVNFGLRRVHRQEWLPLGIQRGEIVKTVPLGPGQKERISTKIVRREKRISTMETRTESETTTESSESTKDSSEVVAEAADTSKWNVDAKASVSFFVSAELSTSLGETSEDKSKRTNSNLSETMQKTASKIRRETKVTVSTETEQTFESEKASEISNQNNEIAITYEYHRIQQQYEVFTHLAEIQSVIYVAERLPTPSEITSAWVRRYDWIIGKVLRDESFRDTLNELIQEVETEEDAEDPSSDRFATIATVATDNFAKFSITGPGAAGQGGLNIPDIYSEPLRAHGERMRETNARGRSNTLRNTRRERLFQHLRDNILHYCRAIWLHEDPEQRFLRYKLEAREVPVDWRAVWTGSLAALQVGFVPILAGTRVPLTDVIDPTGPLGYVGNYAVFGVSALPREPSDALYEGLSDEDLYDALSVLPTGLAPSIKVSLNFVLSHVRAAFVGEDGTLRDPARDAALIETRSLLAQRPDMLANPSKPLVEDVLSYVPELGEIIRNDELEIIGRSDTVLTDSTLTEEQYAEYLYRKNSTRRFLVDSNNLYLSIRVGAGAALEPFKRAHRYIDVLKEYQNYLGLEHKNERRAAHLADPTFLDPDTDKVVVVGSGSGSVDGATLGTAVAVGSAPGNTGGSGSGGSSGSGSGVTTPP